jgi:hypothetical protein
MSNYSKTTNFTAKDNLASGDPAKLILGGEFDTEFSGIQTAVNSKADAISGTAVSLTVTTLTVGTAFTISSGTTTDFGTIDGGTY